MKFYIVDDDVQILKLMAQLLEARGHQVSMSHAGAPAILDLTEDVPDCLITDISMVGMDGIELIKELRASNEFASMKIVVVSAMTDIKTKEKIVSYGVDAFIGKPIDPVAFVERVEMVAAGRGVAGENAGIF